MPDRLLVQDFHFVVKPCRAETDWGRGPIISCEGAQPMATLSPRCGFDRLGFDCRSAIHSRHVQISVEWNRSDIERHGPAALSAVDEHQDFRVAGRNKSGRAQPDEIWPDLR